jgi:hypothetical protein
MMSLTDFSPFCYLHSLVMVAVATSYPNSCALSWRHLRVDNAILYGSINLRIAKSTQIVTAV